MAFYEKDHGKGKLVLHIGDVHADKAFLRTIGTSINGDGMDSIYPESGQILEATHMERALQAHVTMYQALFDLYMNGVIVI